MERTTYLALLRGINVGGKNIIKMQELKELFFEIGFSDVQTYIQSGNVIFKDTEKDKSKLSEKIEKALLKKINNKINIAVLTLSDMKNIIDKKPDKFGEECEKYKYDCIFLIPPLTTKEALKEIKTREGVDEIFHGHKSLYITRLVEKWTKSYLSKISESPIYQNVTVRNWNTTKKLHTLMSAQGGICPVQKSGE